jgi:hypothetical protein
MLCYAVKARQPSGFLGITSVVLAVNASAMKVKLLGVILDVLSSVLL